jgi:hypothetical protein
MPVECSDSPVIPSSGDKDQAYGLPMVWLSLTHLVLKG